MKRITFIRNITVAALALTLSGCGKSDAQKAGEPPVLRIGFFPNITHAQGLIGYHETATKGADGWFEKATGAKVEWYPFNAGPSAIEALLAGSIDITYVGPNPVLNGYTRTKGADIRVLTGAARGGASLVVQKDSGLKTAADFRGKKIASPQLGGTQDIAARAWLKAGGLNITTSGGDAFVVPTQNPDQLDLFKRKQLDADVVCYTATGDLRPTEARHLRLRRRVWRESRRVADGFGHVNFIRDRLQRNRDVIVLRRRRVAQDRRGRTIRGFNATRLRRGDVGVERPVLSRRVREVRKRDQWL